MGIPVYCWMCCPFHSVLCSIVQVLCCGQISISWMVQEAAHLENIQHEAIRKRLDHARMNHHCNSIV